MNTSTENPPPLPIIPPELRRDIPFGNLLEMLLKHPAHLIRGLHDGGAKIGARPIVLLSLTAILLLAAYGLVIGAFTGGPQLLAAPLKFSLGTLLSTLICLPSLFIFTCLTGANVTLRGLVGVLAAVLSLTALLLIGFAPVAWVFSQSTESVVFMGTLHLVFWLVAIGFGLRLLTLLLHTLGIAGKTHLRLWTLIFILVNLQMSTALRPLIGTSTTLLPQEKKFFLAHWLQNLDPATH